MFMSLWEFPSWSQVTFPSVLTLVITPVTALQKHIRQCDPKSHVLRIVASTTIWPGDFLEIDVPKSVLDRELGAVP